MANDTISFSCPACGIKLTVPGSLAGVIGPCPTCRTQIQAPYPAIASAYESGPFSPPVQPSAPVQSAPSVRAVPPAVPVQSSQQATSPGQLASPLPGDAIYPAYAQAPAQATIGVSVHAPPPAPERVPQPAATPAVLRPEPRQLPSRASHGEPVAKQMPEPSSSGNASDPLPRQPHQHGVFKRFLLGATFLLLSAAVVFGVLTVLRNQGRDPFGIERPSGSTVLPILPEDKPLGIGSTDSDLRSLPVAEPAQPAIGEPAAELPTLIEPPPDLPEGIEPKSPGIAALEVLEIFLAAKTLEERMPMMETKTSESDLAASVLARPLPATRSVLIDAQEANALEQVLDIFYNVDFESDGPEPNSQTLLLRIRGSGKPRVVVDPFLDLYGGRLAAYAANPTETSGTFQVIISAVASCNNEDVPNREKKLTLKLLARDNTKEIAEAYFGRQSRIGLMLEDGTYSLGYGRAKACTVLLRWNLEDNPEKPYLEAIDLTSLDWNP